MEREGEIAEASGKAAEHKKSTNGLSAKGPRQTPRLSVHRSSFVLHDARCVARKKWRKTAKERA
jgi:hypothetical protein